MVQVASFVNARAERALRNNPLANNSGSMSAQSSIAGESSSRSPNWLKFVTGVRFSLLSSLPLKLTPISPQGMLSREEQQVISQYEKQSNESVQELLDTENSGEAYAQALVKALGSITEPNVAEYLLDLTADFLVADFASRVVYFDAMRNGTTRALANVLRLLESDSAVVRDKTCALLALLLSLDSSSKQTNAEEEEVGVALVTWCLEQLRLNHVNAPTNASARTALFSLSVLLQREHWRDVLCKHGGVKFLNYYLNLAATKNVLPTQMVYEVCSTIWLVSLTRAREFGFCEVSDLIQLLADNRKEKINRVVLSTLANISAQQQPQSTEWFLQFELARILAMQQRVTDVEMLQDVEALRNVLQNSTSSHGAMTVFDMYKQECSSGKLKASKTTHSERFWKENVRQFETGDFATLKQLVALVQDMADNVTLQVALSDLGYFCQYYPNGRNILSLLGAKTAVMSLLEHPDRMVQKAALVCVSKMLVTQWEFIGTSA